MRFKKVQEDKVDENTKVDSIVWRLVSSEEYWSHSRSESPERVTYFGDEPWLYEIGSYRAKLPTKPGAIVAPLNTGPYKGYNPYVLGNDEHWYELEVYRMHEAPASDVQESLEAGWVIAFEGVDVSND